jgi:polyhydroxybutyrate depolymerase
MNLKSMFPGRVCLLALCWFAQTAFADEPSSGRHSLTVGSLERHYVLRLPDGASKGGKPVPLMIVLHGGGGNAANAEKISGFTEIAKREGFIVAYPEGTGRFGDALLTWNARHCCGYAMKNQIDDVTFIRALIDGLTRAGIADPKRVYATGMSNGGMMTHRLGIELSDRLAAIAPVVGALFGDEPKPPNAVSAIMFNGMLDKSVPVQGGQSAGRGAAAWDGTPVTPAMNQGVFWAGANGCDANPEKVDMPVYVLTRYHCSAGRAVELYLVKDNGHAWPGGKPGSMRGDTPNPALNATETMWAFFRSHSR